MRHQQSQPAEVHLPGAQRFDHGWQAPSCARHHDAVVGRLLREAVLADAEHEHRRKRTLEIEPPLVDLAEVHQKVCFDPPRMLDELARSSEELRSAERCETGL